VFKSKELALKKLLCNASRDSPLLLEYRIGQNCASRRDGTHLHPSFEFYLRGSPKNRIQETFQFLLDRGCISTAWLSSSPRSSTQHSLLGLSVS